MKLGIRGERMKALVFRPTWFPPKLAPGSVDSGPPLSGRRLGDSEAGSD
jgi:hypothetical protein